MLTEHLLRADPFVERYPCLMRFTGDPLPGLNRRSPGIEPVTGAPNAFQGGAGLITLDPGESLAAGWEIEPS